MNIIEKLGIKQIESQLLCVGSIENGGIVDKWIIKENKVRELEQQQNDLLEALIEIIQCDEIHYDNEIDYFDYMKSQISIIKNKPIFAGKSWREIKELLK